MSDCLFNHYFGTASNADSFDAQALNSIENPQGFKVLGFSYFTFAKENEAVKYLRTTQISSECSGIWPAKLFSLPLSHSLRIPQDLQPFVRKG